MYDENNPLDYPVPPIGRTTTCLDHGFVRLVDVMGNDASIVQAARVSYGEGTKTHREDQNLIHYLMRNQHTTPFEMVEFKFHCKMPIFVARQWIRHRTACLAGGVELHFDLPGGIERRGNQLYKLSMKEIYDRFQPTKNARPDKQRNPDHRKERVQNMNLRCLNEDTQVVEHTTITDIWESGVKPVFLVRFRNGSEITMSKDHLCLTNKGWLRLKDVIDLPEPGNKMEWNLGLDRANIQFLSIGPGQDTGVIPQFNPIDEAIEEWKLVVGWESYYEVSDQGRVRRIAGGRGVRFIGRHKRITVSARHAVVSLNQPGTQVVEQVHQLMLEAFIGPAPERMICRHKDGNGLNNRLENLCWGTQQDNAEDRKRDGATTGLQCIMSPILDVTHIGDEMTYDLEVSGPWHNFSANGMIVHNSVNEISARYSVMGDEFFMPEAFRVQATRNKQGSEGAVDQDVEDTLKIDYTYQYKQTYEAYNEALSAGVGRELARIVLPVAAYTQWFWKIDLHNLFRFLRLRLDPHAQYEIRVYAEAIADMVKIVVPTAWEAFEEHVLGAITIPRTDRKLLADLCKSIVDQHNDRDHDPSWLNPDDLQKLHRVYQGLVDGLKVPLFPAPKDSP